MTLNDDHGTLPAHAHQLVERLDARTGISTGGTMHMHHFDFAKRLRQLSNHLGAALSLSRDGYYPSALVVVRAALEHHLMDRLLSLTRHNLSTYGGIGKEKVEAEYARLTALKAGDRPDIARYWWDNSGMNVLIRGCHSGRSKKGPRPDRLAVLVHIDEFNPFTGGRTCAAELAHSGSGPTAKSGPRRPPSSWRTYFRHDKVVKALRANRLLPGIEHVHCNS